MMSAINLPVPFADADRLCRTVTSMVYRKVSRWYDFEELVSEAWVGLIKALPKFEPKIAKFSTYMTIRVRGHLFDFLRRESWVPRLEQRRIQTDPSVKQTKINSYDGLKDGRNIAVTHHRFALDDADELEHAMSCLRPATRQLLKDVYVDNLEKKQIAKRDGVSEAAVYLRQRMLHGYLKDRREGSGVRS